jgi:hypothetical protein
MCLLFVHVFHGRKRFFYGGETDKRLSFWWHWKKGEGRGRKNKRRGKERGEKGY